MDKLQIDSTLIPLGFVSTESDIFDNSKQMVRYSFEKIQFDKAFRTNWIQSLSIIYPRIEKHVNHHKKSKDISDPMDGIEITFQFDQNRCENEIGLYIGIYKSSIDIKTFFEIFKYEIRYQNLMRILEPNDI